MHECPECGQACDCDGEDTWVSWPYNLDCMHECELFDDDDEYEYIPEDERLQDLSLPVTRSAELRNEAETGEQKSPTCNPNQHVWKEEYYGYKCERCQTFIPYGSEPWVITDD